MHLLFTRHVCFHSLLLIRIWIHCDFNGDRQVIGEPDQRCVGHRWLPVVISWGMYLRSEKTRD